MRRRKMLPVGLLGLLLCQIACASGAEAWWVAGPALAREANQQVRGIGRDLADIPEAALPVLRLPGGLIKTVFGPFTKNGTRSGMRDVNAAVRAPFNTLKQVVDVPVNVVKRL